HAPMVQKLALIYAMLDGALPIELRHLEPALLAIEWMWRHLQPLVSTWGRGIDAQIEQRILTVLRERGPMKRRDLQAFCRSRRWATPEFTKILTSLMQNDVVVEGQDRMVGLA